MSWISFRRIPKLHWVVRHWQSVTCALVGLCLTVAVQVLLLSAEERMQRGHFDRDAENRILALQRGFEETFSKLRGLQAVFSAKPDLTEAEFQFAVERVRGEGENSWLFEWAPRVEARDKSAFEDAMRARGAEGFTVELLSPGLQRPVETAYPLQYVSPREKGAGVLGMNIGPRRADDTSTRARDTGQISASAPYVMREDQGRDGSPFSVALYAPVYRFGKTVETVEERREHLVGFVVSVVRIGELLEEGLAPLMPAGISMSVWNRKAGGASTMLYVHKTRVTLQDPDVEPEWRREDTLHMGGREWLVKLDGYALDAPILHKQLFFSLALMLLVTTLATVSVHQFVVRHRQVEWEVERRTRQLRASEEKARAASELKSRILSKLGHELLTPMNGILGAAELMRGEEASERVRALRETVEQCGEYLLAMLRNVMELVNLDRGEFRSQPGEVEVRPWVARIAGAHRRAAEQKKLGFRVEWGEGVTERVRVDAAKVGQVMSILLSNAVKFTVAGEVVLRVEGEPGRGGRLRMVVTDTGIGIEPGMEDRIFERFRQADEGNSRKWDGMGLGLALAKEMVGQMGGGAGPEYGMGKREPVLAEIPCEVVVEERGVKAAGLEILVVDDNLVNRQVVASLLKKMGHWPQMASNGLEAVETLRDRKFDLVLMDVMMPLMDGYVATAKIRQEGLKTPVIALTACTGPEDEARCRDAGMNDFLEKPVDVEKLEGALARWAKGYGAIPSGVG